MEERFLHSKFKINIAKIGRLNRPVVRIYIKSNNLPIIAPGHVLNQNGFLIILASVV